MTTWMLEPGHTAAEFVSPPRHMMVTLVRGFLKEINGEVEFDWDSPLETTFSGTIPMSSPLYTGEPTRDEHLRSADFFDIENYPKITFDGRFTERMSDLEFGAETDLTIRGTTKTIPLRCRLLGAVDYPVVGGGGELAVRCAELGSRRGDESQPSRLRRLVAGRDVERRRSREGPDRSLSRRRGGRR